ncbi:MAG TPA: hypothetical protein VGF30_07185 [Bacteroidia bacterium]
MLSIKYGKLTYSTSGAYNFAIIGPEANWQPTQTAGLLDPHNTTSAWVDPSFIPVKSWSPFSSGDHFTFFLKHVTKQVIRFAKYYLSYLTLLFALLFAIFFVFKKRKEFNYIRRLLFSFLFYPVVYFFILIEERYVWPVQLILFIWGGYLLIEVFKRITGVKFKVIIAFLFISGSVYVPCQQLYWNYKFSNQQMEVEEELSGKTELENSVMASEYGLWHNGLYISYYKHAVFAGSIKEEIKDFGQVKNELGKFRVNYYLAQDGHYFESNKLFAVSTFQGRLFIYKVN